MRVKDQEWIKTVNKKFTKIKVVAEKNCEGALFVSGGTVSVTTSPGGGDSNVQPNDAPATKDEILYSKGLDTVFEKLYKKSGKAAGKKLFSANKKLDEELAKLQLEGFR